MKKYILYLWQIIKSFLFTAKGKIKILVPSWRQWFSPPEKQSKYGFDTYSCVTQAILAMIEAVLNYLIAKGKIKGQALQFLKEQGYLIDGYVHFSRRFTAFKSGTSKSGNTPQNVIKSILNDGLIPETVLPWTDKVDSWSEYYDDDEITTDMEELGKEFLNFFKILLKWRKRNEFRDKVKHSPLAHVVTAWFVNDKGLYYNHPEVDKNHYVCGFVFSDPWKVWDTYKPFVKKLDKSNYPGWAVGCIISVKKNMDVNKFLKDNDQKLVRNKKTGGYGYILYRKLLLLKSTKERIDALFDQKARGKLGTKIVQLDDYDWKQLPRMRFKKYGRRK